MPPQVRGVGKPAEIVDGAAAQLGEVPNGSARSLFVRASLHSLD
jgi:hypothetical protein